MPYGKSPVERALKEFLRLVSLEDMLRRFCQRYKEVLGKGGFTRVEYRKKEESDGSSQG